MFILCFADSGSSSAWSPLFNGGATGANGTKQLDTDTINFIHRIYCRECRMEAEKKAQELLEGLQEMSPRAHHTPVLCGKWKRRPWPWPWIPIKNVSSFRICFKRHVGQESVYQILSVCRSWGWSWNLFPLDSAKIMNVKVKVKVGTRALRLARQGLNCLDVVTFFFPP